MIFLGSKERPRMYVVIGQDQENTPVALSLDRGQVMVAFGGKGMGKTTLNTVIAEGMALDLPGLTYRDLRGRPNPLRPVTFSTSGDGPGRNQVLSGYLHNPNEDHKRLLRDRYSCRADNARFRSGLALVWPGQEEALRRRYPEAVRGGLEVAPLRLSPQDMDAFAYECAFAALQGNRARSDRTQAEIVMEAALAAGGGQVLPSELLAEIKKAGKNLGVLPLFLKTMEQLVQPGPSLAEHLRVARPVHIILESRGVSEHLLMALSVIIHRVLLRSPIVAALELCVAGFNDEYNRSLESPAVGRFSTTFAAESRHGLGSLFGGGQRSSNLPPAMLSLLNGGAFFNMAPLEFARLHQHLRWLHHLGHRDVARLGPGEALMAFAEASDPRFMEAARYVRLRPPAIWSGGETRVAL